MGSWQVNNISSYPEVIRKPASVVVGDYIYCFGGYTSGGVAVTNCYKYHIPNNIWTPIASISNDYNDMYLTAVYDAIHNDILIFGGNSTGNLLLRRYHIDAGVGTYDASEILFDAPYAMQVQYAYCYNNIVYIICEYGTGTFPTYIYSYDTATSTFSTSPGVNSTLGQINSVKNKNIITCMSKIAIAIHDFPATQFVYDVISKTTVDCNSAIPYISTPKRNFANTWTIGSKGFMYGGSNDQADVYGNVDVFDFNTMQWRKHADGIHSLGEYAATIPSSKLNYSSCVTHKGSAYIIGGSLGNVSTALNAVYKFSYFLDAPTAFTTQVLNGNIKLDWVDNSNEETEYQVSRMADNETTFSVVATLPVQESSNYTWSDTDVTLDARSYQYQIKARLLVN